MNWKQSRDPFYRNLTVADAVTSGFFEDDSVKPFDVRRSLHIMSTPVEFIKEALGKGVANPAILVMTGCFAPVHEGHIAAMVSARDLLLKQGYDAVWGYFAPDHDKYVQKKTSNFDIDTRVYFLRKKMAPYDWMRLDLWAALFRDEDINFTEIYYRLDMYIQTHVGFQVPLFFVAGGDNARFAGAFKNQGNCIIVQRPGFDKVTGLDGERIFVASGASDLHSTHIRTNNPDAHVIKKPDKVFLRMTGSDIEREVAKGLQKHFKHVWRWQMQEQLRHFEKIKEPTISLDPFVKGTFNLEISRRYDYMGMDMLDYVARPGARSIEEQLYSIPPNTSYVLYDDDICSGHTMAWARNLLAQRKIKIIRQECFIKGYEQNAEVLDARDFICDSEHGGLVIGSKSYYRRYPYALPWVNPSVRASIPSKVTI